jgi:nitrogen fixation/metabolism regulation signal transduction histidine kinase
MPPAMAASRPGRGACQRMGLLNEPRFLQVTRRCPHLVANAMAVQEANREYQERALARGGLRRMYIGTLTLSLFLAVFGAVLLAVLLGNQLARPAAGAGRRCARGGRGRPQPQSRAAGQRRAGRPDPLVCDMTQQLADARNCGGAQHGAGRRARANLQTILDNLTAGVIVLDPLGVCSPPTPVPPASCGRRWRPSRAGAGRVCQGWKPLAPVQRQFRVF